MDPTGDPSTSPAGSHRPAEHLAEYQTDSNSGYKLVSPCLHVFRGCPILRGNGNSGPMFLVVLDLASLPGCIVCDDVMDYVISA